MKQSSTTPLKWLTGVIGVLGLISVIGLAAQTLGFFFRARTYYGFSVLRQHPLYFFSA